MSNTTFEGPASNVAFVAKGPIDAAPPPANASGAVGWMRENLFRGPVNSVITVLIAGALLWFIPGIIEWAFIDAVWVASSLNECRELGEGACWAVIVERFDQFIYGFYPADERWRPNLTFILMLAAFAFALFDKMPLMSEEQYHRVRPWGLLFSACFPVIAYWLIWGGTIWGPLLFLATPVIAYFVMQAVDKLEQAALPPTIAALPLGLIAGAAAAVIWLAVLIGPITEALSVIPIGLEEVESRQLGGFLLASIIGVAGIVLSLPIGILLALGRRSGLIFIQSICVVFIEFIRGVPLITLLFVASSVLAYFFPPESNLDLILRVVIMVTAFASAYMAEVIRGGLAALPSGQYEAADAMGLNYWQATRLIIMPQALKISIPNIVSTFIGLFKDTTLVVVIGLLDPIGLINTTRADSAWNGIIWEFYVFVGLFFFIACFAMSRYSLYLERKLATDRR
ncbi:MAG: amino acid ABC transporter permease [Pseudomonadota bacterium]